MQNKYNFHSFKYVVVDSIVNGNKEIDVIYKLNGETYRYFCFVPEKVGKKDHYYIKEAKKQINEAIKNGDLIRSAKRLDGAKPRPQMSKIVKVGGTAFIACAVLTGAVLTTYFLAVRNPNNPEPEPEPVIECVYGKYEKIEGSDKKARVIGLDEKDENLPYVKNIVIPEKVTIDGVECEITEIKEGALAGCSSLQTVTLPFIGGYYDINNSGIDPADDPDHVYDYAQLFGYVFGKNIYDGVGKLTWQSFYKNSKTTDETAYRITKAAIPFSLREATITRGNKPDSSNMEVVPQGAFSQCKRLSRINLKQSDTTNDVRHYHIDDYAFADCAALEKVDSPDGAYAVYVDGHALENCRILESFVLNGCKEIGDYTFANCDGIQGINVPGSIEKIGAAAFTGVQSPTIACEPTRDEVNEKIGSGDWDSSWIDDTAMIVYGFVDSKVYTDGEYQYIKVKIDESTTGACLIDFTGDDRKEEYVFPGTLGGLPLVEIAAETYYGYSKLKTIDFKNCTELRLIGNYCFLSCTNLKTINGLNKTKVDMIGAYAFDRCNSLVINDVEKPDGEKTFPNTLKTIGKYAFANCDATKGTGELNIDLSNTSITHMGEKIFSKSTTLKKFVSPPKLDDIGDGIFEGCTNIESLVLHTRIVDTIPDNMFKECENLQKVVIDTVKGDPKATTIQRIGNGAFSGCTALHTILVDLSTRLATIGNEAFKGCTTLDDISTDYWNISMLEKIGDSAFENCINISKIDWASTETPDTEERGSVVLKEIGKAAFKNCTKIETVEIASDALEIIGDEAFYGDKNMTSFITNNQDNENFEKIGKAAFSGCVALTKIFDHDGTYSYIPSYTKEVGDYAFEGCTGISKFRVPWNPVAYPAAQLKTHFIQFGALVFKGWTGSQNLQIEGYTQAGTGTDPGKGWLYKNNGTDISRFTRWGWNMSEIEVLTYKYYCAGADGAMKLVVSQYNPS